ncbi:MAG TPA: biotin/lipoyl-containing protein, partial [Clostridia bacterium]|nr:biotin/lipoyl-containing protein [Clostridia bacterium]
FIAATCKEKGILFLKGEARSNVRKVDHSKPAEKEGAAAGASAYTVKVNDKPYNVKFDDGKAIVNGATYTIDVQAADADASGSPSGGSGETHKVNAPMPGLVLRLEKNVGDAVQEGDLIMVLEAMKMENEIHAPAAGTITEISVKQGDQLKAGELLAVIS